MHQRSMSVRSVLRAAGIGAACGLVMLPLVGCGGFESTQKQLASLTASARFAEARDLAFDPETAKAYGENVDGKNFLLLRLERGTTALAADDPAAAATAFAEANSASDRNYDMSTWDNILQWINNDRSAAYYAKPYEDLYVSVFAQAAHLMLGRLEGAAVSEAVRQLGKADTLRAWYGESVKKIKASDEKDKLTTKISEEAKKNTSDGQFLDSPLGMYLAAVSFTHYDVPEEAAQAKSRFVAALNEAPDGDRPLQRDKFADFANISKSTGNLVVLALSGTSPKVEAETVQIPVLDAVLPANLPKLVPVHSRVASAKVEFRDGPSQEVFLLEDISAAVIANFKRQEEATRLRAAIRLGVKATIMGVSGAEIEKNTESHWWTGASLSAGTLWIYLTEKADTRSWTTLPGQARVGLVQAPAGEFEARVVFEGDGGYRYEGPWKKMSVGDTGINAMVVRCPE